MLTVKWKKQSKKVLGKRIKGYDIEYCDNDSGETKIKTVKGYKKTSVKLKNLEPGTKYRVRIRTYIYINHKRYYSPWSKQKLIKVI